MNRALQTRGVFAIDCRRRGDRLWVGLLLLDGDRVGAHTLVDRDTQATVAVFLPPGLDPISYQVELAINVNANPLPALQDPACGSGQPHDRERGDRQFRDPEIREPDL